MAHPRLEDINVTTKTSLHLPETSELIVAGDREMGQALGSWRGWSGVARGLRSMRDAWILAFAAVHLNVQVRSKAN